VEASLYVDAPRRNYVDARRTLNLGARDATASLLQPAACERRSAKVQLTTAGDADGIPRAPLAEDAGAAWWRGR